MTRWSGATAPGGDRGSVTLEVTVLAPGLLLLAGLLILAGRMAIAGAAVEAAARDAARTASITRDAAQARTGAEATARATLASEGLQCANTAVALDTSGFTVPVGQPADVSVDVACDVALGDLLLPGLPGTRTVTADATSPLDTYRER